MSIRVFQVDFYLARANQVITEVNQVLHQYAPFGILPIEVSQYLARRIHELQASVLRNREKIEGYAQQIHPLNAIVVSSHLDQVMHYNILQVWLSLCAVHEIEKYRQAASNIEGAVEKDSNKRELPREFEANNPLPKRRRLLPNCRG